MRDEAVSTDGRRDSNQPLPQEVFKGLQVRDGGDEADSLKQPLELIFGYLLTLVVNQAERLGEALETSPSGVLPSANLALAGVRDRHIKEKGVDLGFPRFPDGRTGTG